MLGDSNDLTLCVNESRYIDRGGLRHGVLVDDEVGQGWTGIPPPMVRRDGGLRETVEGVLWATSEGL